MPDPQRTILRAPRLPRGVATAALLLVAAGAAFAATVGGVPGGLGGGALALLGLGAAAWRTSADSRRFEGAVHGRVDGLIEELEEHRRTETRLRADMRALSAECSDSEERRRRAESADRAKTAFLSNLSLELRTPLNNVLGLAGILLDTRLGDSQADYARTIHSSAEALITVVDDILDLSRLDDGELTLDCRDFEFSYCVEGVVESCAARAAERDVEIELELDPSLPTWMRGDRRRLRQVLIALVHRAIGAATEPKLRFAVRKTAAAEDRIAVGFEIGRPPAGAESSDAEATAGPSSPAGASTSVNLSLATRLAQHMGGALELASDGAGAVLTIELFPCNRDASGGFEAGSVDLGGMRMLLISGSEESTPVAEATARSLGMELDVAPTGTSALELLRNHTSARDVYAIIAIDADLPDVAAGDLVGILRRSHELRDIGYVLLYEGAMNAAASELSQLGFDAWLKTPLSETRLRTAVLHVTAAATTSDGRAEAGPAGAEQRALPHVGADVLLAEDNLVNQKVTALLLQRLGCRVSFAASGMQAIEQVMTHDFDIVLMDCLMPELSGFDATRAIRRLSDPVKNSLPIVALTAGADEGDRRACLEAGMNAHLPKPVRAAVLARVLQHWTGNPVVTPNETAMSDTSPLDPEVLASLKELGGDDPSIFNELVELFLSDTPERMRSLETAQASGDPEAVAASAHALKSSCGNLGAMALYEMFRDIESSGKSGDVDAIESLIPKVRSEFVRVEDALRREAAGGNA